MALNTGQKLKGGKYTIETELGRGRFGITYLARDRNGNGHVIKTLNDQVLNDPSEFERWQRNFAEEAFKLAKCKHRHIVEVEDSFEEAGLRCIAMEYIEGTNLAHRAQAKLPEAEALRYIRQIGEALSVVHSNNLVHRDVRPENIMVRAAKSEAVLIDFGLAREFDHDLTMTRAGDAAEGFAPPELYLRNAKRGAFTDVYSLAATLYVLLTGQLPTSAKERKFANASLVQPKEINPQISDRTNRAILAGMQLEAKDRPQTVREWLELLGLTSVAPDQQPPPVTKVWKWEAMLFWTAVASVAGVLAAVAAWVMPIVKPDSPPASNPTPAATPQVQTKPTKR
ncbi:serine/threonine protein kinase [Tolypothrix campylonemoides VB511288]|nr:serine/threonine protein kinase [Tolypothrix campylonemoides VB511288]